MVIFDNQDVSEMVSAILSLENEEEAHRFLRDLMTGQELVEFGKRWKVARMLSDGASYAQIESETRLSSTTIARISKWLQSGSGGYQMMIDKLSQQSLRQPDERSLPEATEQLAASTEIL